MIGRYDDEVCVDGEHGAEHAADRHVRETRGGLEEPGCGSDNKWALRGDLVTPLGRFSFRGRRAAEQPERPRPEEARAQFDAAWESLGERARRRDPPPPLPSY